MLNLRGIYHSPDGPSDTQTASRQFSDMQFASRVIGNFGAPLETDADRAAGAVQEDIGVEDPGDSVEVSQNPLFAGLPMQYTSSDDAELQDSSQNVSQAVSKFMQAGAFDADHDAFSSVTFPNDAQIESESGIFEGDDRPQPFGSGSWV